MRRISPLSLAVMACLSAAVIAEENPQNEQAVERILVQGDFRQEQLQKLPGSILVLSQQDISRQNAQHLDDLLQQAANVNFSAGASRGRFLQIRGIGERSEFVDSINPSVGVLIDGIDYSALGVSSLADVQQVEIFRGPEATRFGANAMAGMLNLTSNAPSFNSEGQLSATLANYDSYQLAGAYSTAINQQWAYRLAVDHQSSDGFIENIFLNRDDTNHIDETSARAALRYLATKDLTLDFIAHYRDIHNGYDAFSLDLNRTTLSDKPGQDLQQSRALAIKADYQGLSWANVYTQLSGLTADTDYGFDEDWSYEGIHPDGYATEDRYLRERDQWSLEQRFLGKDQRDWVLGWYASGQKTELERQFWNWDLWQAAQFFSDFERQNMAAFGQWSTDLGDGWSLTSGARAERYDDEYSDSNGITQQNDELMWGGKLSLSLALTDSTSLYLLGSRGYKAGGVNGEALGKALGSGSEEMSDYLNSKANFSPETLWNAEFGVKGSSADQTIVSRVAVFAMWRDDMQVNSWVTRDQSFVGFIDNAASGRNHGLELESRVQLTESWTLFANAAWLESEIRGFITEEGVDKTGRDQAHAPNYQYSVNSEWLLTTDLSLNLGLQSKAAFYYSDSHDARSEQMHLVNLRLQYQWDQVQLAVWSRNALDEEYGVRGFYFDNDPRDGWGNGTEKVYEQLGEPRRIGVTASYQF
ncbi:outer membrane receptor protein [Rheinheimera sp. A13L]|uniref:TonB-dependent receptor n=1 Tax=Rheinheimera sp. A13L TaxID=506534 RepID=UPI00021255CC|nr:TonB-dependent receptor [Rheinheimera sp. A13L]EGM76909.1 outer membrane receptor protein [Rheinheimera sp. A13L]